MTIPEIPPSLPTGTNSEQYKTWCKQAIAEAKSGAYLSKTSPSLFVEGAKILSQLILPPPEICEYVWSAIKTLDLTDEVEKVRQIYEKHRETIEDPFSRTNMQWLSLPPLSFTLPSQELSPLPISLASQTFICLSTNLYSHPLAYWNGLTTCSCPRKSPESVDTLTQIIADDLKPHQEAVIIDFGPGGCMTLPPLITRLTHLKTIHLYLIDPIYSVNIQGTYLITNSGIQDKKDLSESMENDDFPVIQFLQLCVKYLQKGQQLYVEVCPNTKIAVERLNSRGWKQNIPYVLYTIDPPVTIPFCGDFNQLSEALMANTKSPSFYCLNLMGDQRISTRDNHCVVIDSNHLLQ